MSHRILYVLSALCLAAAGLYLFWGAPPTPFGGWLPLAVLAAGALFGALAAGLQGAARKREREAAAAQAARLQAALEEARAACEQEKAAAQEFVTGYKHRVAHSLRMPASIIQGYTDILLGGLVEDEEAKKEYLQKIGERSTDLNEVLNTLMGRVDEDGDAEPVRLPFDILRLLEDTARDMAIPARQRGIDIRLITVHSSIPYTGDEHGMRRALYNIVENAIKYMGRPGAINITAAADAAAITITVKDDGLGMEAEEVEDIFNKGYQGSNSLVGSGTGLYLTRLIVQRHGGEVTARSGWGLGMGITIRLPLQNEGEVLANL